MPALLFGSISTVVDTSELQRRAFNQAFQMHDLDWEWERDDYRGMLAASGGQNRIAAYAQSLGQQVDARAIYLTKSQGSATTWGSPRPLLALGCQRRSGRRRRAASRWGLSPRHLRRTFRRCSPRSVRAPR